MCIHDIYAYTISLTDASVHAYTKAHTLHSFFIRPSTAAHLSCSLVLALEDNVAVDRGVQIPSISCVYFLQLFAQEDCWE